jgi:hypothetical protein
MDMRPLRCDMTNDCEAPVTYVDEKGFTYCTKHGLDRKYTMRCRKIKPAELRRWTAAAQEGRSTTAD